MTLRRWSGAGNTFFICDEWAGTLPGFEMRPEVVRAYCQAFPQAATDGFVFLQKTLQADFRWDFYNADGSIAEMCGNAARCAAMHFSNYISGRQQVEFLTLAGAIRAQILASQQVLVHMPLLGSVKAPENKSAFYINTGVPHIVLEEEPDVARARQYRPLPDAAGSNVTFITVQSATECKAVTFERGVEGFTQACGTGAVAAAVYMRQKYASDEVLVHMPGGDLKISNTDYGQRPRLIGPVELTFKLETWMEGQLQNGK